MAVDSGTHVVLLGTAGGAATYPVAGTDRARNGIATAVVIDGRVHLVDTGQGVVRQLTFADIGGGGPARALSRLRAVYLTHLHSDHTMDLANLVHCSYVQGWPSDGPVDVYGPGPRAALRGLPATQINDHPGAGTGTVALVGRLLHAYAADFYDRTSAGGRGNPADLVSTHDLLPPPEVDFSQGTRPTVEPWLVAEDDSVRVTATLVSHGSMLPSLAYRFDTAAGSVVVSGDTEPSQNLVRLARGADVLVHEVIASAFGEWQYGHGPLDAHQQWVVRTVMAKHTSTDDVGAVAQAAGVGTLVLSHLVPGSMPAEQWEAAVHGFDGRVVVGEDLLTLEVGTA